MLKKSKEYVLQLFKLEVHEVRDFVLAFVLFFCLLCGYYILRPLRDEMGIQGGVRNLQWVFSATFVGMLLAVPGFGWIMNRFPRWVAIPVIYYFFIFNLAIFYAVFLVSGFSPWIARVFFIWVSVYNLFIVSVFWSLMNDVFDEQQARRLFGGIAAGGSAGAIIGPALTSLLSQFTDPLHLLPVTIVLLMLAVLCIKILFASYKRKQTPQTNQNKDSKSDITGGILSGATRLFQSPYLAQIALFLVLYSTLSTFLYFEQAHIVKNAFSTSAERTALFANMDLIVNILTIGAQLLLTSRLVGRVGLPLTLALVPLFVGLGFLVLAIYPVLITLVIFQVIRRAGNYAVTRPAREMLYSIVPAEDKYKAKNFIDTVVYRGGDAVSGWLFAVLKSAGLTLSTLPLVAVPLALLWAVNGYLLGKKQIQLSRNIQDADEG